MNRDLGDEPGDGEGTGGDVEPPGSLPPRECDFLCIGCEMRVGCLASDLGLVCPPCLSAQGYCPQCETGEHCLGYAECACGVADGAAAAARWRVREG